MFHQNQRINSQINTKNYTNVQISTDQININ